MAYRIRCTPRATLTFCSTLFLLSFGNLLFAQDETKSDPWFKKDHRKEALEESVDRDSDAPAVTLNRINKTTLAKRIHKQLNAVPEADLNQRIGLLEQIVDTGRSKDGDVETLGELRKLKDSALQAIQTASQPDIEIAQSIDVLAPYSNYYRGDSELLVALLKSPFSDRLYDHASGLARRSQTTELANITSKLGAAGLSPILGRGFKSTVGQAATAMIARRWAELSYDKKPLPGEGYLIGQLLGQNIQKLSLAIELPPTADPRLSENITRGIESSWGSAFRLTSSNQREADSEFALKIDVYEIEASSSQKESKIESLIPGAVVEEANPDFIDLVERYEKAAKSYEMAKSTYESMYQDYIEKLDDTEYRDAQQNLGRAKDVLSSTPLPPPGAPTAGSAFAAAQSQYKLAEAMANSVEQPYAVEPTPPHPYHLKILDELYLVPSTIVIGAEETPYEYTEKTLNYQFATEAPITLTSPVFEEVQTSSTVSHNQSREWTKTEGVHPRDPLASTGTYSESEYNSALDLFGLEFATNCSKELTRLLETAVDQLSEKVDMSSLPHSLMMLSLQTATGRNPPIEITEEELAELASLAKDPTVGLVEFRSACLSILLSKTEFAHLAGQEEIARYL